MERGITTKDALRMLKKMGGGSGTHDEQARRDIADLKDRLSNTVSLEVTYEDGSTDTLVLYGGVSS